MSISSQCIVNFSHQDRWVISAILKVELFCFSFSNGTYISFSMVALEWQSELAHIFSLLSLGITRKLGISTKPAVFVFVLNILQLQLDRFLAVIIFEMCVKFALVLHMV